MSSVARDRIRRCLAMIPLIRARPGIRVPELASIFGVRDTVIWEDITEVLSLCGVPPYLPHNYLVFSIDGDRVSIRFAEHLSRPVHLTLQEALAIDLALRTLAGGRLPLFGDAALRLRHKVAALLRGPDREALEAFGRVVAGAPPSALVTETIALLKEAMARNVCLSIKYYTSSRDDVNRRTIEPRGLVDHNGRWYVIAKDHQTNAQLPFRVDRILSAYLLPDQEYEVPEDFTTAEWRREEMWKEGPQDIEVHVAFGPESAPRVREEADRRDLKERPGGRVVRTYRIDRSRPRWLQTEVARYGPDAEVLGPPEIRRGMAAFLDSVLAASDREIDEATRAAAAAPPPRPKTTATAASAPRPRRARTRRKPPSNRG